jgi:hypothetical protein
MPRALRILGRIGAGVSLFLCVAVVVVWIDSYYQTLAWRWNHYVSSSNVVRSDGWCSADGRLGVCVIQTRNNLGPVVSIERDSSKEKLLYRDGWGTEYQTGMRLQRKWIYPTHNWWERNVIFVRSQYSESPRLMITSSSYTVAVSYWVLFMVSGMWPGLWMWCWWRRRARPTAGVCSKCGYDLRASPDRCPECGAVAGKVLSA